MAIPTRDDMWRPILEIMATIKEEAVHRKSILEALEGWFINNDPFTEDEWENLLRIRKSGQTRLEYIMGWALSDLYFAGLLLRPSRGYYQITVLGRKKREQPDKDLRNFIKEKAQNRKKETQEKRKRNKEKVTQGDSATPQEEKKDSSPDEGMELLYSELNSRLAVELLERVKTMPPASFEQLVVHLLSKMGYGQGETVGQTGDGGIDGIINQDALGLEKVYIQAKRWGENQVGDREIRNFSGSLDGEGATKGVFITSSTFSKKARERAKSISQGNKLIRLIDGKELVRLMVNHDVGVVLKIRYDVKQLDENFFA